MMCLNIVPTKEATGRTKPSEILHESFKYCKHIPNDNHDHYGGLLPCKDLPSSPVSLFANSCDIGDWVNQDVHGTGTSRIIQALVLSTFSPIYIIMMTHSIITCTVNLILCMSKLNQLNLSVLIRPRAYQLASYFLLIRPQSEYAYSVWLPWILSTYISTFILYVSNIQLFSLIQYQSTVMMKSSFN